MHRSGVAKTKPKKASTRTTLLLTRLLSKYPDIINTTVLEIPFRTKTIGRDSKTRHVDLLSKPFGCVEYVDITITIDMEPWHNIMKTVSLAKQSRHDHIPSAHTAATATAATRSLPLAYHIAVGRESSAKTPNSTQNTVHITHAHSLLNTAKNVGRFARGDARANERNAKEDRCR